MRCRRIPQVAFALAVGLWAGPASAGPSLADQQLEYAKEQYGKGVEAMDAKEFKAAVGHFEEAYKYAPDKHAFNFNIAEAALAAGDCHKARASYQRFLELQPDHPEVDTAKSRLNKTRDCGGGGDPGLDSEVPDFGDRGDDAEVSEDMAAVFTALQQARRARALYEKVVANYDDAGPFPRAARKHKRQVKKLIKLIIKRGESPPESAVKPDDLPVAGTMREVCGQAEEQEAALVRAYEEALKFFDGGREKRILGSVLRDAQKHEPQFKFCRREG